MLSIILFMVHDPFIIKKSPVGKMSSMVGGNKNDNNQSHKMMGGVAGGRDSNRGQQEASMGDKVKGTFEQAKGKVMNDPHTARKGDMRKDPAGAGSNDFMGGAGI
ncbi:hypothetical protein PGTUg99_018456 [Puccinia graminis f. sp. tritici]|uniref:Uncharacterized protein n=1 Tax=Puccinia graminis f. sp. tritici TaxID=56615 RepID=A0A5B0NPI3_PUCGR|nr:hypothetical protein PGTUg99_018456 [Puccinia graminis f. sp. tritici]